MTQHNTASAHHPHPAPHPHPHPAGAKPLRRRKAPRRVPRLIIWEWGIVLGLLAGLGFTVLALSHGPDPRRDADLVVSKMKAALAGKSAGDPVTMHGIPPKVCVLAAWDLYRLGTIAINGVTPQRVSAAKLVELCNDGETATIVWTPK
jgi:hypothetical protein